MAKYDQSDFMESVFLAVFVKVGKFLFPAIAVGIALYNRINERTLTLDIISGLILGAGIICYYQEKEIRTYWTVQEVRSNMKLRQSIEKMLDNQQ